VQEGGVLAFNVAATDPDADSLILSVANLPTNATFVDSANGHGRFRFAPNYSQSGVYNLLFLASDGVLTDTATVQITVFESGNQRPQIDPVDPQVVNEGEHLEFVITATDPEGSIPLLSAFNRPTNSTFADSGNGHGLFTFNPDFFQAGVYNVSFIAFDGQYADTEVVSITVQDVGFPPVLDPIGAQTVVEGGTLQFVITASDPDLVPPALSAVNLPANAAFTDSSNGHGLFIFNPDYTQAGVDSVLFIASDGVLADSEYVAITITEFGNVAPILEPIANQALDEGDSLAITVVATDPDGTVPQLSALDLPTGANFIDNTDGTASFVFAPTYYQAGVYTVTFIASDGALADSAIVEITVTDRNGPPVMTAIGAQTVAEGDSLGVILQAVDPDNDMISFTGVYLPTNATITDNGDGSGVFSFLPDYTQAGIYGIILIASDGIYSDSQEVTIDVSDAGNQAPQFAPLDTVITIQEGDSLGVIISASDPDNDPIEFTFAAMPFNSTYENLSPDSVLFIFKPNYTQVGTYNVSVTASDGSLNSVIRLHITVQEAGDLPPQFDPVDPQVVVEGDSLVLTLTAVDLDGSTPPVITVNNQQTHSEFHDNGDGTATYIYRPDYYDAGIDTVVFIAIDEDDLQGILSVQITTNEFNIRPDLLYEGDSIALQGTTIHAQLIASDSTDGDGGPIYLSSLYLPTNGSFVDNGNHTGTFTFSPSYEQLGMDSAIFLAVDAGTPPMSRRITVHLEVRDQNRAPVWDPIDAYEIDQAETLSVALSAHDPDGDTLILRFPNNTHPPKHCSVVDNGDGTGELVFAPDYTQAGVFVITLEAYDLIAHTRIYVFINVNDLGNQTPTLNFIEDMSLVEGETLQVQIVATDPDSTIPTITVSNQPYRFNLTPNGDGTADIYFNPLFNQAGTYELLFKAADSDGAADSQFVNLEVIEAGNQEPRIGFINDRTVNEGQSLSISIVADDPDSTIPALRVQNLPANATFADNHAGGGTFVWSPSYFQAGSYIIVFEAVDAEDSTLIVTQNVNITVNNVNRVPTINPAGPYSVNEGDSLRFTITGNDPDSTIPLLRQGTALLNSAFADSGNGRGYFLFRPDFTQAGQRSVNFLARDVEDTTLYAQTSVTINIINVNRAPVFNTLPDSVNVPDSYTYTLTISATDPDGTTPTLSASNLPTHATFADNHNGTGTFQFITTVSDVGVYDVTFVARDAQNSNIYTTRTIRFRVYLTDYHPPLFATMPTEYSISPDSLLTIRMVVTDLDGDQITFTTLGILPAGSVFADSGNGISSFSWMATEADSGSHVFGVVATDDSDSLLADTLAITIEVINWIRGDANGDGRLIGSDVTYLVNYFRGIVPRPYPTGRGDANADGLILGSDVTYLVNYFRGGPAPPPAIRGNGDSTQRNEANNGVK
jgi:hypothetical protein